MLDADMNMCYWTLQCNYAVVWDRRIRVLVALTASGTAIAALSVWSKYPSLGVLFVVASAVLAVVHPIYFPADKPSKMSGLVSAWKEIMIRYELLWDKYDEISSEASWKEFEETKRREAPIDDSLFPLDTKLREKAFQQVLKKRRLA
jgi:hypothetical protein